MTITEKPNLTLYGIETQLLELMRFREEIEADPDITPQEQAESLKACDESIEAYLKAEVKKVDGIAGYLRECEAREDIAKQEADRIYDQGKAWKKRREQIEMMVQRIMELTNTKRLDGRHSVLALHKSPASVEVAQPDMVPAEYQRVTVTMSAELWKTLQDALAWSGNEKLDPVYFAITACKVTPPEPEKRKIAEALKTGDAVPGCRLITDKQHLVVK